MLHTRPPPFLSRLRAASQALGRLLSGAVALPLRGRRSHVMNAGRNEGPPDLDELWRDFNRKLTGLFGGKGRADRPDASGPGGPGMQPPDMKTAGIGAGLIAGVVVVIWLLSGFYIVQEGEQAVVTTFGKYSATVDAGFQWRLPYPFQSKETVAVTQLRSVEVGRNTVVPATGLRDSSMLTMDENIVDIRFTVQYRLKNAREFLYENRDPEAAVLQASESAVREIVGRSKVDQVLYEQRDAIAADLVKSVQMQLDRLNAGIIVVNLNVQNVQVPEQVQAAFNDAVKAGADRDRLKNEGQAYASDVIPKARGTASRLKEESEGYRAQIIARAEGDSQRFSSVLTEYQRAPQVTRDRMYLDTMQQIYGNVTKVLIDSRTNSNLLYLPLDKLMQQVTTPAAAATAPAGPAALPSAPTDVPTVIDARSRDGSRSRDREGR
jgi:modulator of FtsH protease HflK